MTLRPQAQELQVLQGAEVVQLEENQLLSVVVAGEQWARFVAHELFRGIFVVQMNELASSPASWQMPPVAEKFAPPPDATVKPPPVQVHPHTHSPQSCFSSLLMSACHGLKFRRRSSMSG